MDIKAEIEQYVMKSTGPKQRASDTMQIVNDLVEIFAKYEAEVRKDEANKTLESLIKVVHNDRTLDDESVRLAIEIWLIMIKGQLKDQSLTNKDGSKSESEGE